MTDSEMFDWIDSLEEFSVFKVEEEDGTIVFDVTADDEYFGRGETIRAALRAAYNRYVITGGAIPDPDDLPPPWACPR
jgi:hypothetical protein